MTILNEILRTICAIRRAADCDVERLCFEVTQSEMKELLCYLYEQKWDASCSGDVVATTDGLKIMGIRVREVQK